MARYHPKELADHLKDGLLSFPVTPFTPDFEVDAAEYQNHVEWQSTFQVAGLFAAGGTGEGFSLTPKENYEVTKLAVEASTAEVPVLGSAGGPLPQAVELAKGAEKAGAEGILVLPPYLTEGTQEGLFQYVSAIASATSLGIILYDRANAHYYAETVARLADTHENFVGYKDSRGNIEHLARVTNLNGNRLFYLGGLPTAETFALPLLQMGVSTYSSALFNFLPEFALEFYADVRSKDSVAVNEKLRRFVLPYISIRDRAPGYGVSIVKAGLNATGRTVGSVRPPLQDLTDTDFKDLTRLIEESGVTETHTTRKVEA